MGGRAVTKFLRLVETQLHPVDLPLTLSSLQLSLLPHPSESPHPTLPMSLLSHPSKSPHPQPSPSPLPLKCFLPHLTNKHQSKRDCSMSLGQFCWREVWVPQCAKERRVLKKSSTAIYVYNHEDLRYPSIASEIF